LSTLFTLSTAWHDSVWLFEQLCFAREGDAILLLEDAVLAAHSPVSLASFMAKCSAMNIDVYVLQDDCEMRGIDNQYEQLIAIDYARFVELSVKHDKQVAW